MSAKEAQYNEALNYIYSFVDYSLTRNLRYSPEKFDLSRMVRFVESLGNPLTDYKVIHIAGTKGKGSTGAMIANMLTCAGYKTGFYSSPHLLEFTERIQIDGRQISKGNLVELTDAIKPFVASIKELTTFEIITAIAFQYFSQEKVDYAVVEVGMGGRLDATNVVTPALSVITSISHDHMKVLGSTLPQIAMEKAGIIKPGIPVVITSQRKNVEDVISSIAESKRAPLIHPRDYMRINKVDTSLDGQHFCIEPGKKILDSDFSGIPFGKTIFLPLMGDHQLENARTALVCMLVLHKQGCKMSFEQVEEGMRTVEWPGRFEILNREPLLIVDGAHNRDSFRKLKATIEEYLPDKKKILIFGASEDKEVELMLNIIQPCVNLLVITKADHPRALDGNEILKFAQKIGMVNVVTDNVEDALKYSIKITDPNSVIVAAGSLFIAGAIKEIWSKQSTRQR